jgi:hypothetical protein
MEEAFSTEHEPELVAGDALRGITVGISVSDSADLSRLGLTSTHCELAVAELARAIFLASGTLVYGGQLVPGGFTDILVEEVRRYRDDRDALVLCVPESEHRRLTNDELARRETELHTSAELVCLDTTGEPISITTRTDDNVPIDVAAALTGMRRHITGRCDARVVVGGKLSGFEGTMPGVLEEALLSVEASQPLYIAGGFGGAAAAVALALGRQGAPWYPPGFPDNADQHEAALGHLRSAANATPPAIDGLSDNERHVLAATHRPGDIASLVVTGLGRFAAGL